MSQNKQNVSEKLEAQLFKAADKLRKNIDAAEYKHIVLGLIFLKYISDSFEELHSKLQEGKVLLEADLDKLQKYNEKLLDKVNAEVERKLEEEANKMKGE